MFCKKCGAQIPDGSAVCPNCGDLDTSATLQDNTSDLAVDLQFTPSLKIGGSSNLFEQLIVTDGMTNSFVVDYEHRIIRLSSPGSRGVLNPNFRYLRFDQIEEYQILEEKNVLTNGIRDLVDSTVNSIKDIWMDKEIVFRFFMNDKNRIVDFRFYPYDSTLGNLATVFSPLASKKGSRTYKRLISDINKVVQILETEVGAKYRGY